MSGATVMIVDDDDDLRETLAFILERGGYRTLEAAHGREALDHLLARGLPDLILLDMNMPVMDGWALARELRARGLGACPVVVLTAAHDAQRSAEEVGAAGFIGKPFELETLLELVRRHVAGAGASAPPPTTPPPSP
jgi:CheY-like chemotaxis protein